jgi:hypothetical protein
MPKKAKKPRRSPQADDDADIVLPPLMQAVRVVATPPIPMDGPPPTDGPPPGDGRVAEGAQEAAAEHAVREDSVDAVLGASPNHEPLTDEAARRLEHEVLDAEVSEGNNRSGLEMEAEEEVLEPTNQANFKDEMDTTELLEEPASHNEPEAMDSEKAFEPANQVEKDEKTVKEVGKEQTALEPRKQVEVVIDESDDEGEQEPVEMDGNAAVYFVCQALETQVTACPVGKPRKGWPYFVSIPDELVKGKLSADRPLLQMGDLVSLVAFKFRDGFRKLCKANERRVGRMPWLNVGVINAQAVAEEIGLIIQGRSQAKAGIILEVNFDRAKQRVKSFDLAAPGLRVCQRIYRRQFGQGFVERQVRSGGVIKAYLAEVSHPPQLKVGQGYILPRECRYGTGKERNAHQPEVCVEVGNLDRSYVYPFRSVPDVLLGEQVMAAALAACIDQEEERMSRWTIVVVREPLRDARIRRGQHEFGVRHRLETKSDLVKMADVWQEDTSLQVKIANKPGAKSCARGIVEMVEMTPEQGGFIFFARVRLFAQDAKGYDAQADFEAIARGAEMQLKPKSSLATWKARMAKFEANVFSSIASEPGSRGSLMKMLLGISSAAETPEPFLQWANIEAGGGAAAQLHGAQRETARHLLDELPRTVWQQAPPGTGKTFTAESIVARALNEDKNAVAICVAPLNVAVVKLVLEMEKALVNEGVDEPMLALFSGTGKVRYRDQVATIGSHLLAAAVSEPELLNALNKRDKRKVDRYLQADPKLASEREVAQIFLAIEQRRIIFCTLSLLETLGGLFAEATHLILDECGQAPYCQVLAALEPLKNLKKVLVTGDRYQLNVHLLSHPQAVRNGFGLDTIIQCLDEAKGVNMVTLTVSYRSHPDIVRMVEAGAYRPDKQQLEAGRPAEERGLLARHPIVKCPVEGCPIVLIHDASPMLEDETSHSSSNDGHTELTIRLLTILSGAFQGSIRIVCLYRGQCRDIGMACTVHGFDQVVVTTADGTQGHEADLVVLVTTVSGRAGEGERFWADSRRVNVAASRARHGLFLIGDLAALWESGGIWRRMLKEALEMTVVVMPDYIEAMAHPNSRHGGQGVLLGPTGTSLQAFSFYERQQQLQKEQYVPEFGRPQLKAAERGQAMDRAAGVRSARPPPRGSRQDWPALQSQQQQQRQVGRSSYAGAVSAGPSVQHRSRSRARNVADRPSTSRQFDNRQNERRPDGRRGRDCFKCGSPNHLQRDCPRGKS